MATWKIKLDKYNMNTKGLYPVKLVFGLNSKEAALGFGVYCKFEDWDSANQIVKSSDSKFKRKNGLINEKLTLAEKFIDDLKLRGRLPLTAKALRDAFENKDKRMSFNTYLKEFIKTKEGKTKEIYGLTLHKIEKYFGEVYFDDITAGWLSKFDQKCVMDGNKINTRNIHFRNIRSIFNNAIDNDVIKADLYPFRRYKLKSEETEHRAMNIADFRKILKYSDSNFSFARDVFMLSFYLIGINLKDLYLLENMKDDRIIFKRSKTKRVYDIKIEPEALELISKYKGKRRLLNFCEHIEHSENLRHRVNKELKGLCDFLGIEKITSYAARHSWGTFAAELEIPKETISAALGHGKKTVTDIYIRFDKNKVDDANKKVIDFILCR